MGLVIRILPREDRDFVRAFDRARTVTAAEDLIINAPKAATRAEELLHAAGYPRARVDVERTVDVALAHAARWKVTRDGYQL